MTSNQPQNVQQVFVQAQPSNGLGTAGFVLSLIGILSCGFLSPLGLILAFAGMFKQPRGLATAGLVLGLLGSIWIFILVFIVGFAAVTSFIGLGAAGVAVANQGVTVDAISQANAVIQGYRAEKGALPNEDVGQKLINAQKDAWGRTLRYKLRPGGAYDIRSAGPDGQFDTLDDITGENVESPASPPRRPGQ
jgi:type II secretory pathway pseudopilin PulG